MKSAFERDLSLLFRRDALSPEEQVRDLLGRPDFVFRQEKVAVFAHGCYWHAHECLPQGHVTSPNQRKRRVDQIARDQHVRSELEREGWAVLVIWECHFRDSPEDVLKLIRHWRLRRLGHI